MSTSPAASKESKKSTRLPAEVLASDHFRIYCCKVLPCTKRFAHDWKVCAYAHPQEAAKRRDPRKYSYTGVACPHLRGGSTCPLGDACPCAHNVFEYWLHPTRYRTQTCTDGGSCKRAICFFAHSDAELRRPECKPFVPAEVVVTAAASLAGEQSSGLPAGHAASSGAPPAATACGGCFAGVTLPTEPVHPTSLGAALALQQALQRQQQRTAQAQGMDAPGAAEATLHHTLSRALRQLEAALPPPMPSQQAQQQQVRQQQQQGGSRRSSLDGPAPPLDWLQLGQQEAGGWGEPALWSSAASSCSMSVSSYPSSARSSLDSGRPSFDGARPVGRASFDSGRSLGRASFDGSWQMPLLSEHARFPAWPGPASTPHS